MIWDKVIFQFLMCFFCVDILGPTLRLNLRSVRVQNFVKIVFRFSVSRATCCHNRSLQGLSLELFSL
jgi:hypothetical protein